MDGFTQHLVLYREQCLNTTIQVALHHIRASQVYFFIATVAKIIDTAMLQETPYDTAHPNSIADTWYPGTQAADAAHKQIVANSRLRCVIQGIDNRRIGYHVHLEDHEALALLSQ